MRKWTFFILAILATHYLLTSPLQDHQMNIIALSELAHSLGIAKDEDLIFATQKYWLRKNQERWELAELSLDQKELVLDWATREGLFDPWKPFLKTYDKALILGASTPKMQMRLDYLKELWEEGIRFKEIVWLTGERPLNPLVDHLFDRANNESQAAQILWEEALLPEEMHALLVSFVSAPMKVEGDSLKNPNTEDTLLKWLKIAPLSCPALFVSDQPFCGYQFAVIKTSLPETIQFDLVGKGMNPTHHPAAAAVILDTIARWIYQESLYQRKKEKERHL